jgi:hypothetical protein
MKREAAAADAMDAVALDDVADADADSGVWPSLELPAAGTYYE